MSLDNTAFPTTDEHNVNFPHWGLTTREYAAIHLKVPMSGNAELDAMIIQAKRDDFAKAALVSDYVDETGSASDVAELAYKLADAMLVSRNY